MKKTMLSLAAASLVMGTAAYADVNVDLGGQVKFYYETNEADGAVNDLFDQDASKAAIGIQLDTKADLGNGVGFGAQATFLDNWGLSNNIATNMPQQVDSTSGGLSTDITLTQLYLTKKIDNTTVKGGRQTVSKGISPLVYSEGWNVFKNTVDAVVISNTDVADTTLVAAYFSAANGTTTDMNAFTDLNGGVYMAAVSTKAIPNVKLTANYYHMSHEQDVAGDEAMDAIWADAQVTGLPVSLGLQYGNVDSDASGSQDTTAYGVSIGGKVENVSLKAAYTSVDDGDYTVKNWATGIKTPLYTQMIFNQNNISGAKAGAGGDSNTWLIGAAAGFGDMGKLIVNYSSCEVENYAGAGVDRDLTELDVIYKIKSNGVQYFAAYVMNDNDDAIADNDKVRFWAAYAF